MKKILKNLYSAVSMLSLIALIGFLCYKPAGVLVSDLNVSAVEINTAIDAQKIDSVGISASSGKTTSFFNFGKESKEETVTIADVYVDSDEGLALFKGVIEFVEQNYVEDVKQDKLTEDALKGMIGSLDPHSAYLTKEELKDMSAQTRGEFGGLGIELTVENSLIKVISPIEGTPAEKIGILPGDYISHIDNKPVMDMTLGKAVTIMRGEPGTKVKITVLRKGEEKPLQYTITRQIIKVQAVRSHREGDVAYVKINTFSEQAYPGLQKHLAKLINEICKENLKGVVLDLRGNPGGLLDQSVDVAGAFLNKGDVVVSMKGRNSDSEIVYRSDKDNLVPMNTPMVVLINEGSASASEIVAGALQDNKRAIVMGIKSFGKGSVQSITELNNGGAVKMTIARYYTPSGRSIQALGVEPDIVVSAAKIEPIKREMASINEADLFGHLENDSAKDKNKKDSEDKGGISSLYDKDYQLARAVDLLLGLSLFDSGERLPNINGNSTVK